LTTENPNLKSLAKLSYKALGTLENPQLLQFSTAPFRETTEITGHIVAHLNVSMNAYIGKSLPKDIDLFLTLRHIRLEGEVFYTGTAGDPVPLCKGWLRVSFRKINASHTRNRDYLPHRDYFKTDVLPVLPGEVYPVDVEIWPTNVVLEKDSKLVFEVSSGDTQGSGIFLHAGEKDRYVPLPFFTYTFPPLPPILPPTSPSQRFSRKVANPISLIQDTRATRWNEPYQLRPSIRELRHITSDT
jgi:predicted acyl esterase